MIYFFEDNMWADGNEAVVKTELGDVALRLESKSSFANRKIIVFDRYHVEIGLLRKKLFRSGRQYEIQYDDKIVATLIKKRFLFSRGYILKTAENVIFKIKGKISDHEYKIVKGGKVYAQISQSLAYKQSQYGLETKDDRLKYSFLCVAVLLSS